MGKKLDFSAFEAQLSSGKSFEITDWEYQQKVGQPMPKTKSYLKNTSPLADLAHEYDYRLEIADEAIVMRKIKFIKEANKEKKAGV